MSEEREELNARLKALEAEKRSAKGVDDQKFVSASREILSVILKISRLSSDNLIGDRAASTYCWALYAVAVHSSDRQESVDCLARLVLAFRRKIDCGAFWGDATGAEFGKTLFSMMVVQLHSTLKSCNEGAETVLLKRVAKDYLEILDKRAAAFLDDAAFKRDPITAEQRANMERSVGKKIRMKAWPSLAEKAFGIMNHCLKADASLAVSPTLVDFLGRNVNRGEWLGFYCANARIRLHDWEGARSLLSGVVSRKSAEAWAWSHLAEAYGDKLENAAYCYQKALICPSRDKEIALGMTVKIRRALARVLFALGKNAEAEEEVSLADGKMLPKADDPRYVEGAKRAEKLLPAPIGPKIDALIGGKVFSGVMVKHAGNKFGFVKDKVLGQIFIPPRFAGKYENGQTVKGKAALRKDAKKNRMSYCMIADL